MLLKTDIMETIIQIFSIIIGKWLLESIGVFIRKSWLRLCLLLGIKKSIQSKSYLDGVIDYQSFINRIVGFCFLLLVIFVAIIILN